MKTVLPTICALDCPDACSLEITVDGDRVTKLAGQPSHPVTRGFACAKMYRYPERQEHPDRLLEPLRRVGAKGEGRFETVSWDQALDGVADRLSEIIDRRGPQAILPYCYSGTLGKVEGNHPLAFFRAIGASELDQTICAATGGAGWEANYGPRKISTDPEDLVDAKLIILWGINALRSNTHIAPFLKEARHRGAWVLHIDPFRNETSRFADEHWQIRVGTDAALALAFGNQLFASGSVDRDYLDQYADGLEDYREHCRQWPIERAAEYCGIDPDRIRHVVDAYGRTKASYIKVGYGMTRNEGGGNAIRAITLLPALTGAWKHAGGGAGLSTSGAFPLNTTRCNGEHLLRPETRHINMNCLGTALQESRDPIESLVVFNSNPAAVAPDSSLVRAGLSREDLFTVVLEHFQTDTADYADYVLPATTFLEHPDLYTSYGHYYLQWAEPVVAARGQARPNTWIFAQLARRLGVSDASVYWTAEQLAEDMLDSDHPWLRGITWSRLRQERSIKLNLESPFRPYANGSHFPDGKIRFSPSPRQLEFEEQPDAQYPYRLISPPGNFILNTSMGNLDSIRKMAGGQPRVMIHPRDAATIGIEDGQMMTITSRQGSIRRQVIVSDDARCGTVIALGQWWPKLTPDRKSLNDLTSQRLTDLGGGSTFGNPAVACTLASE
jgi:anaerobic selenocysteine-containing dehydrogenase